MDVLTNIHRFAESAAIDSIIFIGGEPTVYPHIFEAIELFKGRNITFVTNGVALSDENLCKKYLSCGVTRFSVSIKAKDREGYKKITKRDCFDKVLSAISNLRKLGANFSVSYVITADNVFDIPDMVKTTQACGAEYYFFSVCRNFNLNGVSDKSFVEANNPYIIAQRFEKILPWLKANTKKFSYAINEPLCTYSEGFLQAYLQDFYYPCYLHNNTSITFDPFGYLIPCNTIHQIKVGLLGKDFHDIESYLEFERSEQYTNIYKKLRGLPDVKCNSCDYLTMCRGRCVCNWTNYTFQELQSLKRTDD